MAFRLADPAKSPNPVDMDRVAAWYLDNLQGFERINSGELITLPSDFLSAVSAQLLARFRIIESAIRPGRNHVEMKQPSSSKPKVIEVGRPAVPPKFLNREDAAHFLGIRPESLEHLVKQRKIRYVQIGDQRNRVFRIEDLERFASERTVTTAEEEMSKRRRRR